MECATKSRFLPTRVTLIERLQAPANTAVWQAAWSDFYQVYWRVIYSLAMRKGLSQNEGLEVIQIVLVKIQGGLKTFEYDPKKGRFLSWIGRITRNEVFTYLRGKVCVAKHFVNIQSEGDEGDPFDRFAGSVPEPDGDALDSDLQQAVYAEALSRVRARRSDVKFRAFELHWIHEVPVGEVAKRLGISPNYVSVATNQLKAAIVEEGRRILKDFETDGYLL